MTSSTGFRLVSLALRTILGSLLGIAFTSGCAADKDRGPVTFRVLDPTTRSPVEGVGVKVQSYRRVIGPGSVNKFRDCGETDAQGCVTIRGLEENLGHSITFAKPGYMLGGALIGRDSNVLVPPALPPGVPWSGPPSSVQSISRQPIEISLPKLLSN